MPDIYTPAQVAECRERAERATEGPWEVEGGGGMHMDGTRDWYTISCPWNEHTKYYIGLGALKLPEAEFVAHARTDIPELVATIEWLAERIGFSAATCPECSQFNAEWDACKGPKCDKADRELMAWLRGKA
jgi:hypothetical protein